MNITELAEQVATAHELDKAQTRKVIEAALKAVVDAAKGGAEVTLPGFGKFKVTADHRRAGCRASPGTRLPTGWFSPAARGWPGAPARRTAA